MRNRTINVRQAYMLKGVCGATDMEIAESLSVSRATAFRIRKELGDLIRPVSRGRYIYIPTADDIAEAHAILQVAEQQQAN